MQKKEGKMIKRIRFPTWLNNRELYKITSRNEIATLFFFRIFL